MSDFQFADPLLVHALWGVAAFVGVLFWLDRRGGSALERLVAAPLHDLQCDVGDALGGGEIAKTRDQNNPVRH